MWWCSGLMTKVVWLGVVCGLVGVVVRCVL